MRVHRRGRYLGVILGDDLTTTSARLEALGIADGRAAEVAAAATQYAQEETEHLTRQLTPKDAWPGHVCLRRHIVKPRDETWLMLRYDKKNFWTLDAVFVM
jgi:hypothetical protein